MNTLFANKFYGIGRNIGKEEIPPTNVVNTILCNFENENPVFSQLYKIAMETGALPNDLDISLSKSTPEEFRAVLSSLQRKFPTAAAFSSDKDAFEFIVSRYAQFGSEVQPYLDEIADQMEQLQEVQEVQVQSSQPNPE